MHGRDIRVAYGHGSRGGQGAAEAEPDMEAEAEETTGPPQPPSTINKGPDEMPFWRNNRISTGQARGILEANRCFNCYLNRPECSAKRAGDRSRCPETGNERALMLSTMPAYNGVQCPTWHAN